MDNEHYSYVIIDDDNMEVLEKMLEQTKETAQDLSADTIVVIANGKKESEEFFERMKPSFPNLRVTFVPDSSRLMDSLHIAITLGIKAAQQQRVYMLHVGCPEFSPFRIFANKLNHRKLERRTNGKGVDFCNTPTSICLDKQRFLERENFDENLQFVYNCYLKPAIFARGMWLIRIKYLLAKCHMYHI
jgi:hypothetical protein